MSPAMHYVLWSTPRTIEMFSGMSTEAMLGFAITACVSVGVLLLVIFLYGKFR